jgi:serine/threonine-protein kinase
MMERSGTLTRTAEVIGVAGSAVERLGVNALERTEPLAMSDVDLAALDCVTERERRIRRSEHSANVQRLRRGLGIGVAAWVGSTLLDLFVTQFAGEGNLPMFLVSQGLGTLVGLAAFWRLRRLPEPSVRTLWACDIAVFTTIAVLTSVESLAYRGIDSPYAAGIIVVMVARGTTTFAPWRHGALLFGAPALAYPLTVAIAAAFDTQIGAQLREPQGMGTFVSLLYLLLTSWLLLTCGGHFAWRLRRDAMDARRVGRYRLEQRLGSGGMGDVWAAFDLTLQHRVALKTTQTRPGSSAVERFEREVRALAQLAHPNTVRVLDYGVTEDGLWYYAMELLTGENLRELAARQRGLEAERVGRIAVQVLRALGEAHDKGIVHRDIKPENIFLAELGGEPEVVKLLDFGIAKATTSADVALTHTGHIVGTPAFMAPEVIMGRPADVRSDVYSFGATLYYALSGRLPFTDDNQLSLFEAHLSREPEPLDRVSPRPVPGAMQRLVERCMAKAPGERYGSTQELLEALRAVNVTAIGGGAAPEAARPRPAVITRG